MLRLERLSISNGGLRAVVEAEHPAERPAGVTGRRFDLDDVGAPVGHDAAGRRSGHPHAELDNLDPVQRSRHRGNTTGAGGGECYSPIRE